MNFSFKKQKTPLPVNAKTAKELKEQMKKGSLRSFGKKHILIPAHFLISPDPTSFSPLHHAAFWGNIDQIMETLKDSQQFLSSKHFLAPDETGVCALAEAAWHNELPQIFDPSYWVGRVGEMETLWQQVQEQHRGQIDYEAIRKQAILMSVRAVSQGSPADFVRSARKGEENLSLPGRER